MKIRRRYFSLVEVLIAMALLSVIMLVLFSAYGQVISLQYEAEQARQGAFERRYTQSRLSELFQHAEKPTKTTRFFFTQEDGSLVFTYDNGAVLDPLFCNQVLGRLYLDRTTNTLNLATWPAPKKTKGQVPVPMHLERILEGVSGLSFRFFYPSPESDQETPSLPAIVWVELEADEQPLTFAFPLPKGQEVVTYGSGEAS